jgi:hypothetical protein
MIFDNGHRFEWEGQQLEVVKEFKYLGILFTCDGNMKKAAERMQEPCTSYGPGEVTN